MMTDTGENVGDILVRPALKHQIIQNQYVLIKVFNLFLSWDALSVYDPFEFHSVKQHTPADSPKPRPMRSNVRLISLQPVDNPFQRKTRKK